MDQTWPLLAVNNGGRSHTTREQLSSRSPLTTREGCLAQATHHTAVRTFTNGCKLIAQLLLYLIRIECLDFLRSFGFNHQQTTYFKKWATEYSIVRLCQTWVHRFLVSHTYTKSGIRLPDGRTSRYLRNGIAKKIRPESHQDPGLPIYRNKKGQDNHITIHRTVNHYAVPLKLM